MTALPLSVEAQLRARLDLDNPLPLEGLTSYCGCSSLAPAIATGISKMDRDMAQRRVTRTPQGVGSLWDISRDEDRRRRHRVERRLKLAGGRG